MKRGLLIIAVFGLLIARPQAVSYNNFEQITVDATAGGVPFTAGLILPNVNGSPQQATIAVCRVRTAEISYRTDGRGAVTASVGTLLEVGDTIRVDGYDSLVRFRAIRTTGSSGQLDCNYYVP